MVTAVFAGLCANNDERSGNCLIQENKPKDCREYKFGGEKCLKDRQKTSNAHVNFFPVSSLT